MPINNREDASLKSLLRLANLAVEEKQRHLFDLETARNSLSESIEWLAQSARDEEQKFVDAHGDDVAALNRFQEGVRANRAALLASKENLRDEIDAGRSDLDAAFIEVQKLEHLLQITVEKARKDQNKKEALEIGEHALRKARK